MDFPIVGPAYSNRSIPTNAQELVNMFLHSGGPGGRDMITRTPGLSLYATAGTGAVVAAFNYNNTLHVISGTSLYRVTNGTATLIGTISGTIRPSWSKYVSSAGVNEVFIVRGSSGYTLSGSTLTQVSDADFPAVANYCTSIKNIVLVASDSNTFYGSDVGNSASWNGLWFDRTLDIGDTVAILEDHAEIFVFGTTGIQVVDYVAQGSAFPFAARNGAKIEVGCLTRDSIAQLDNSFIFLGDTEQGQGRFWRVQGYQPLNITAPALEEEMATYTTISDAVAFSYYEGGHEFYCVTFPAAGKTWCYDASIGDPRMAWHRRESYGLGRWRANCHAVVDGVHFVGDGITGNIYKMKYDIYDDNSLPMVAKRTTPHGPAGRYTYLKLGVETGVGLVTGQGSDPQVMLRTSEDDGRTFGTYRQRSFGAAGDYKKIVQWHGLGTSEKQRTFEISCSDPVPFTVYYADVGFEPNGN